MINRLQPQNASHIYWHFNQSVMLKSNKVDNFESLYTTMTLFYIEMANDELFLDSLRLALSIQVLTAYRHALYLLHYIIYVSTSQFSIENVYKVKKDITAYRVIISSDKLCFYNYPGVKT